MQALQDIFTIFGNYHEFAKAVGREPDTVYRWTCKGRIPQDCWHSVITAAASRGVEITLEDLFRLNRPMKKRGRPAKAHAMQPMRAVG